MSLKYSVPAVLIKTGTELEDPNDNAAQDQYNWRNIVFLPFNRFWQVFLICCIAGSFLVVTVSLVFNQNFVLDIRPAYYFCEAVFLINTIAIISHRNMASHRKTRYHPKTSSLMIFISVVSLVPLYEISSLLDEYTWKHDMAASVGTRLSNLKCTLRLINVMMFFKNRKQEVGFTRLLYVVFSHSFYFIIMVFEFTNIWELFRSSSKPNWGDNLQPYMFNETHVFEKLFLSLHVVLGLFTHNWIGIINGVTFWEKVIVLVIILTGFVFHMMFFYGELTAELLQSYRHQFEFKIQLRKIMYLLDDWKVNKNAEKRTIEYYKLYWEKRSGINRMPRTFELLPTSLRKEIMMDIFWEALRHSPIFSNVDISFKRSLCLHMVNKFHLPGDLIFKAEEIKDKMVYVVTGKIQLLSNEDNESPFLTLSGGTLLGEVTALCLQTSKVSVRCDTFCEIQTLDIKSLFSVLLEYRSVTKYLNKLYNKRIDYAKWASSDRVPKYDPAVEGSEKMTIVMKLKNQWKFIASYNNKKKTEINWKKTDRSFTSKYLSTLVLADSTELKGGDICLQSKCPFIMQSDSNFIRFLNYLVTGSVIVQITVVPYAISFSKDISSGMLKLMLVMDLFYWLDIYLQLSTAITITNSITLVEPKQIIQYQFKQWRFILDIISAIPVYYISLLLQLQTKIMLLSNVLRLLKVPKLFKLIQEQEKYVWIDNIYIQSAKYFVLSIICVYWGACILFATSCFSNTCHPTGWYLYNKEKRNLTDANPFAKVLSFSISLLLNTNLSDYAFFSISDIYICIVFLIASYVLTTFTLAELTASVALLFKEERQHQNEVKMFQIIMERRFVHKELKGRLLKILEFNWEFIEGAEIQGKRGILSEASREIRTEIINERFISCFKLVPLLKNLPETLLQKLSLQAEVIILPPDTYVQNVNVMSHNIYIILRGYCQANSTLPGDAEREAKIILKRGDMLAIIETLHRIKIFGSIVSITAIELMSIHYETFIDIFQSYRNEYMFLQNALREHKTQFDSILMRRGCRLPKMKSAKESLGRVDTFRYKVDASNRKQTYNEHDLHIQTFKSLGSWAFVRFLLFRKTINPKSTIYVTWEVFRCTCILVEVVMCIIFIIPITSNVQQISYAFRAVGVIDIYIKLHCQYYNRNGIIVRHPLYTAQKYVGSSFAVDVITNLPVDIIWGSNVFGKGKGLQITIISQLILRPFLLYRVFHGLTYLQNKLYSTGASVLFKMKTAIIVLVILGLLANVLLIATCTFDSNFENCTGAQYIEDSVFSGSYKTATVFLQALYFNVESFTHSVSGVFGIENDKEIAYFLTIQCILYCLRYLILALYTSSWIGGNVNLSIHQAHMKQFISFAKDLLLEENLTEKVVEHYEHVWKETLGTSINVISSKFNLYLRIQFLCFLYEGSLRNTKLFALAPAAIVQRLAPCLREVHFKRGGIVIRCNDVQKNVYFVHKGEVDITVANTVLTTLDVGGLFGCFHRSGIFRQTFTATCMTHTILLALDSTKLQEIVSEWDDKHTEEVLGQIRLLNVEYMEAKRQGTVSSLLMEDEYIKTRYEKIVRGINRYVDPEGAWYRFFDYILNVHFAAIASISNMAYICIYLNKNPGRIAIWLFYATDLIFWIKIFLGFHIAFVNPTTGLLERKAKKIAVRYLKTDFALDLFSCLPIELASTYFLDTYSKLATFNRVLRFIFMIKYYRTCQQRLLFSKHLRWSYLIYKTMFRIQLMANVWFLVSCLDHNCDYVKERFGRPKTTYPTMNSTDSALVGYTYTINIFTTTGMRDTIPTNWKELLVSIAMALFAQYMIANMASGFAQMIIIDRNTMATYQYNMNKMKIYLSGRHLSPALLHKAWEYYMLLWHIQEGECLPTLITMAPSYLKQDVMLCLFGYHLENHFLFAKTHKDFIRQLVTLLERRVYLPGNVIVEKGDVDSTIYFVHSGEVGAFDKHGSNEVQCFVVKSDMSFGEAQGLYNIPHKMAYKSLTVTFVLALRKSVWEYLLKWFPASQETIVQQAAEYNLKSGQQL